MSHNYINYNNQHSLLLLIFVRIIIDNHNLEFDSCSIITISFSNTIKLYDVLGSNKYQNGCIFIIDNAFVSIIH